MKIRSLGLILLTATIGQLSACYDNPQSREYRISITNLTHGQPLSPPVAVLHKKQFSFWEIGESASHAIELMAEGGDASQLLELRKNSPQYQADAALAPGEKISFTLKSKKRNKRNLSIAGMLVNTNDAFSGLNSVELSQLKPGQTRVYYSNTYDAGTEFNSELVGTIPGPADSGEGFNPARDDVTSVITLHGGIVSVDDNHPESTLSEADKFDNPSLRIIVTAL